jgi:hypothetical protein
MILSRRSSTRKRQVIQKEKRNRKGGLIVSRETFGERAGGSDMRKTAGITQLHWHGVPARPHHTVQHYRFAVLFCAKLSISALPPPQQLPAPEKVAAAESDNIQRNQAGASAAATP